MKYELNIRQRYSIELNDEDLKTYLIDPEDEDALDTLVMIIRYKTDVGDLDGAIWYSDLLDNEAYNVFVSVLHPQFINNPEAIKFGYTAEYEEEMI